MAISHASSSQRSNDGIEINIEIKVLMIYEVY
jgi:hypothetical protein